MRRIYIATIGNTPWIADLLEIAKAAKVDVIKSKDKRSVMLDDSIEPLFE